MVEKNRYWAGTLQRYEEKLPTNTLRGEAVLAGIIEEYYPNRH